MNIPFDVYDSTENQYFDTYIHVVSRLSWFSDPITFTNTAFNNKVKLSQSPTLVTSDLLGLARLELELGLKVALGLLLLLCTDYIQRVINLHRINGKDHTSLETVLNYSCQPSL